MSGARKYVTCPQCGKNAHSICGRKGCSCETSIPPGELSLLHIWALPTGVEISDKLGSVMWKVAWALHPGRAIERLYHRVTKKYLNHKIGRIGIHPSSFMMECEKCPYCGYANSYDFWVERSMDVVDVNKAAQQQAQP